MTVKGKGDARTLRDVIRMIQKGPADLHRDCPFGGALRGAAREQARAGYRIYMDSWVVPQLRMLLDEKDRPADVPCLTDSEPLK